MNPSLKKQRSLPIGISRVWCYPSSNGKPYEVFQVSGVPNGVKKCWKVCTGPRGEKKVLAMAKAKRAEWAALSKPWGSGGRVNRLRVDPKSVPPSMRFPGLEICPHRAIVMATRKFTVRGKSHVIYLCYPYDIEGGSLPTFADAMTKCLKGQGVLNSLNASELESTWKKHKAANLTRKRGETMANALLSFCAFNDGVGSKQEMAAINHAYERIAS